MERLEKEVGRRLEAALAADAALKEQLASGGDEEVQALERRLGACRRDLETYRSPLESISNDATLAASVQGMIDGIRAAYNQRIEELEAELQAAQAAAIERNANLAALRAKALEGDVWRAYNPAERAQGVRDNIMAQVDAYLDRFRPFIAWGAQRPALLSGLKAMMQLQEVLLDSRMAVYTATRDYFESVDTRKRDADAISSA